MDLHLAWLLWARGGDLAATVCCVWAWWRGGSAERIGAAIIAIAWLLSFLLTGRDGQGLGVYVFSIDVITLVALAILAIWSRRLWVFFATACMINAVISHFIPNLARLGIYGYVTAVGLWSGWLLILCLAWGIVDHRRRLRRLQASAPPDEA